MRIRRVCLAMSAAVVAAAQIPAITAARADDASAKTATPIKHVIVIVGENHTFDNVFATYQPREGQSVRNLLSKGIVTGDGRPGENVQQALQRTATNTSTYSVDPTRTGSYNTLPQPDTTYAVDPKNSPDPRFPGNLPNAPFQITKYVGYNGALVGDPIHRFYQMWQQIGAGANDLFVWTANTAGLDNGANPPKPIHQGGLAMGYYNVNSGDAPVLKSWADSYAMSDNYHQSVMGGTGANHVVLGSGDDVYYSDGKGNATVPPSNQIENPNPKPGTNNNFTQDGYSGGTYSNCSDATQPGVGPVQSYLKAKGQAMPGGNCAPGHYYLLNNYAPGYLADGTVATGNPFTVPPSTVPTIADSLARNNISWKYYGEGFNHGNPDLNQYCDICNPFQYSTSVMTSSQRNNLQDMPDFQRDVQNGTLPAVSFVKPNGDHDGHPAYSSLSAFEGFSKNVVDTVKANHSLWKDTAILVTFDEGGGYYDSGYVQPLSFFGDGTRVPMLVVSPYARKGYVDHTYTDHTSVLKFIERNWELGPLSARSMDRLPNPTTEDNAYVPTNGPAIGDLMTAFDFSHAQD